jgi:hypothetical protein
LKALADFEMLRTALNGMVELLHADMARRTLGIADAIAGRGKAAA